MVGLLCMALAAQSQSYTVHVQQKVAGSGSVVIKQSKELDELVDNADVSHDNRKKAEPVSQEKVARKPDASRNAHKKAEPSHHEKTTRQHKTTAATASQPRKHESEQPVKEQRHQDVKEEKRLEENQKAETEQKEAEDEMEIPTVDMRKKVMRRSYKVNGYRVQVFAGGNSRRDKIKAQQAGNAVKMAFPEQPVYVHFYSPRWICRVGNFRSYEEASKVMRQIRKMGYRQACIVSGKITVAY